jgi:large subunit ribosomal protein L18
MITVREKYERRARRTRFKIRTANKQGLHRLSVHISNKHIYAQVIDDVNGHTIAASTSAILKLVHPNEVNIRAVAIDISQKVLSLGIKKVIFDKGGRIFGKRFQAFTQSAQTAGLMC